jgi:hypothetical protein
MAFVILAVILIGLMTVVEICKAFKEVKKD